MPRPARPALRLGVSTCAALALVLGAWRVGDSAPSGSPALSTVDSTVLKTFRWRSIGPDRGGRSIAVSGVKGRAKEAYFGAVGGGLWKTTDGGENWAPVTDGQIKSSSVGAVAVSESNPDIVYIGTGETCIRGNIMAGDGVYKSADAGKTWTHIGFEKSENISKIRIHPTNPDIIFVAAFGKHSAPNEDRGVYKSIDGGKSWKKVLYRDDKTAAIDISIDRNNPNIMYAAMWEAYRKEFTMSSGGPGSGLFKSIDGGETWTEITRNPGMPKGLIGRIGVSVSGANSKRVYALVENEDGGLLSSDDAGATWKLISTDRNVRQRAFYYTHVFADPKDENTVYMLNTSAYRSTDGGKTMVSIGNGTHGDHHDLWIDPDDTKHLVNGNDGGGAVSMNTGASFSAQTFPTEQFYHIAATAHLPYHVCGSQQDNTTLCVPFNWNYTQGGGRGGRGGGGGGRGAAPTAAPSYQAGGGEPGYIAPDPLDPDVFYSGTNNGGYLDKFNRRNEQHREVNPYPWFYSGEPSAEIKERWQWTYPIVFSKLDPKLLFVSSQRLWKTRDGGQNWTAISGDLTRHDPNTMGTSGGPITGDMNGPEVYGVIFSVGPSKKDINVIWTGSDDGLVHVTKDGGKTWTNVTPKGLAAGGRVQNIDPSPHRAGTAYVAIYRFLLGDFAPYIYRTDDFGKSWTRLTDGTNGIAADEPTRVVREDPDRAKLLYAGTEFGMHVSFDDGAHWQKLQLNLPATPVTDIAVHAKDLVLSTQGRAFWVLDNLTPLHQMAEKMASAEGVLYAPRTATRMKIRASGGMGRGVGAQYPTAGAQIDYYLAKAADADITIEILDAAGKVVRTLSSAGAGTAPAAAESGGDDEEAGPRRSSGPVRLDKSAGMHRLTWDLRYPGPWQSERVPEGGNGPMAVPGAYAVRLTVGAWSDTKKFTLIEDPRVTADGITTADLQAQFTHNMKLRDLVSDANRAVSRIRSGQTQFRTDAPMLQKVNALASQLITPPIRYSQPELATHISYLYSMTNGADQKVPKDAVERLGVLRKKLDGLVQQINALLGPRM